MTLFFGFRQTAMDKLRRIPPPSLTLRHFGFNLNFKASTLKVFIINQQLL